MGQRYAYMIMGTNFIRLTTEDKLILSGNLYTPDTNTKKAILHIHGMSGNFYENRFLDAMAATFTQNGYAFLSPNNRGAGIFFDFPLAGPIEKHKLIGNAYEKFEECVYDIRAALDYLEKNGYTEIILQGHSLGSVKVAYYAAIANDKRISKLILISPSDMVGLGMQKDCVALHDLATKMVTEGNGRELLPKILWGWAHLSADTFLDLFTKGNPVDVFNTYMPEAPSVLANIQIPTFAIMGGTDDAAIIPIPEALEMIRKKSVNCKRFDSLIIGTAPHSYFGYEQELADSIISWVSK